MRYQRTTGRQPKAVPAVLLTLLMAVSAGSAAAEDVPGNIEYDIVRMNDSLAVWLNLARYFGADEFEAMADGIDYACTWSLELKRPRRFFGASKVATSEGHITLSNRLVTEDFVLHAPSSSGLETPRTFLRAADVRSFLSDSIYVRVAAIDSLDRRNHYVLKLSISCISLTSLNLATKGEGDRKDDSPLKFLFRQFLKLTGYARDEYSTTSRQFSLSEVYGAD